MHKSGITWALGCALALLSAAPAFADGSVTARVRNGALVVRGDDRDNHIEIAQIGPTTFTVTGRNGTQINGGTSQTFELRGVIKVNTFDGDDTVFLTGPDARNVKIVTGDGNDLVEIDSVFVDGKLNISTGSGADRVTLRSSDVARKTLINTGSGDDRIEALSTAFQAKATLLTGSGADQVVLDGVFGGSQAIVKTGAGNDTLTVSSTSVSRVKVNGGADRDTVVDGGGNNFSRPAAVRNVETGTL